VNMQTQFKAGLWLVATFAIGAVFGMVLNGALSNRAVPDAAPPAGPAGFVAEMERLIQPRDNQQREQLRPLLERTDATNRAIVDGARVSMAAALDSLRVAAAPLLDSAQARRLSEFSGPRNGARPPGMGGRRRPPPGMDGRGGRPPDGRRGGPPLE